MTTLTLRDNQELIQAGGHLIERGEGGIAILDYSSSHFGWFDIDVASDGSVLVTKSLPVLDTRSSAEDEWEPVQTWTFDAQQWGSLSRWFLKALLGEETAFEILAMSTT
jgi:hypothetical protein